MAVGRACTLPELFHRPGHSSAIRSGQLGVAGGLIVHGALSGKGQTRKMSTLSEAIEAARTFRLRLDPVHVIDQASGFSASHLDLLVEWADTCSDAVAASDEADALEGLDVTQLGDASLAQFYFAEVNIDPDLRSDAGQRLRAEIEQRGLTEEQLAALAERDRQTKEAAMALDAAERNAPPRFPDDVELPGAD